MRYRKEKKYYHKAPLPWRERDRVSGLRGLILLIVLSAVAATVRLRLMNAGYPVELKKDIPQG